MRIKFHTNKLVRSALSISHRSGARGSKDWYVSNIILYWNRKVDPFLVRTLPKLPIISKNCSNKSCWELNFIQKKSVGAHVYLSRGRLYTFRISHFAEICECFRKTPTQNMKHTLYTFRISCEFCVLLMPWKNELWNPLTFNANADPGAKCEKWKKWARSAIKVTRNTSLYTFCFLHFAIVFAYFVIRIVRIKVVEN